ncbi:MAG: hypothetical protein ACI81T_004457 [Bacteroidia bacterium]|jgi:hypothetical protein
MTARIKIIKEKLSELRELDKGFSVFGSERHKFQFHDTLTEEEIQQIESENGIIISKDYRLVLTHFGNGGPGGGYGLEQLSLKNIHPEYVGTDFLLRN